MSDSMEFDIKAPRIRILYVERKNVGRWAFKDLRAPYLRLYHQGGPGAWVDFGKGRVPLQQDHLYLIPAQTAFSSGSERDVEQFYIHFTLQSGNSDLKAPPLTRILLVGILQELLGELLHASRKQHQALLLEGRIDRKRLHMECTGGISTAGTCSAPAAASSDRRDPEPRTVQGTEHERKGLCPLVPGSGRMNRQDRP